MTSVNLPPVKHAVSTFGVFWEFPTSVITSYTTESTTKLFVSKDIFTIGSDSGKESSWRVVVNPCFMEKEKRYISIYMRLVDLKTADENNKFVDTLYQISLLHPLSKHNLIYRDDTFCQRITLENNQVGWDKFMEYSLLGPDPHPTMYFYIELNILGDPKTIPIYTIRQPVSPPKTSVEIAEVLDKNTEVGKQEEPVQTVQSDMQKLVTQINKVQWDKMKGGVIENADFHIYSADQTHLAHSLVLKAKSLKIKNMLKGSTPSAAEPYHFPCNEWPGECIEAVLEFCYTGDMTKFIPEFETLCKLAELSASLQIDGLAQLAREIVLLRTDADNFYEVLLAIIQINEVRVENLKDSEAHLKEKLLAYTRADLIRELLALRPKYPSIISDYKENVEKYAVLLFDQPMYSEDEDTSDDDYEQNETEEEEMEDMYQ